MSVLSIRRRSAPLGATCLLALALQAGRAASQESDPLPELEPETALESEPAPLDDPGSFVGALKDGRLWVDLRYRFEFASSGARPDDSYASTLRTVLGYETAPWHGLSGLLEFENVSGIGPDDYNSLENGETDRPPVPDAPGTSVNRAYLAYEAGRETELRVGRQYITLDNQRWVANRPWRQKFQTFDAAGVSTQALGPIDLYYAYIDRINTVLRTDLDSRSHVLNLSHEFEQLGRLTGYGYLFDLPDNERISCFTAGVRFAGERALSSHLDLLYQAELAQQVDAGDNPDERDATYYLLDLGLRHRGVRYQVGNEVLGGDGNPGGAVQVPYGKRFFFNGWANLFVATPDAGLRDYYGKVIAPWRELEFELAGHDFHSDADSSHYGSELDFAVRWRPREDLNVVLGVGSYFADEFATDVTRAWLLTRFSF